jgi:O-acetyl-ADP-ribose deacetylase (regulator of RNase III)
MKTIKGDLIKLVLQGEFHVIIHGCNCFNVMGSGIAKQIKKIFPEAYKEDLLTKRGDKNKLGNYSSISVERNGFLFSVVNAYTQYNYGYGLQVDYEAVREVFKRIKNDFHGLKIGYPKIGAGLGGGDWNIISKIIDEELYDENHILVEFLRS